MMNAARAYDVMRSVHLLSIVLYIVHDLIVQFVHLR